MKLKTLKIIVISILMSGFLYSCNDNNEESNVPEKTKENKRSRKKPQKNDRTCETNLTSHNQTNGRQYSVHPLTLINNNSITIIGIDKNIEQYKNSNNPNFKKFYNDHKHFGKLNNNAITSLKNAIADFNNVDHTLETSFMSYSDEEVYQIFKNYNNNLLYNAIMQNFNWNLQFNGKHLSAAIFTNNSYSIITSLNKHYKKDLYHIFKLYNKFDSFNLTFQYKNMSDLNTNDFNKNNIIIVGVQNEHENKHHIYRPKANEFDPYIRGHAFFPSSKQAGREILINSTANNENANQIKGLLIHEIGHAIGLRHTDWKTRKSCNEGIKKEPDAHKIAGTPENDDFSIMQACVNQSTFSFYDLLALQKLY